MGGGDRESPGQGDVEVQRMKNDGTLIKEAEWLKRTRFVFLQAQLRRTETSQDRRVPEVRDGEEDAEGVGEQVEENFQGISPVGM